MTWKNIIQRKRVYFIKLLATCVTYNTLKDQILKKKLNLKPNDI